MPTPVRELELIQRSSRLIRITLPDVPSGATVSRAWLYVKPLATANDAQAVLIKEIDPGASEAGQITGQGLITDTGADGSAVLNFFIGHGDLDALTLVRPYWMAIKVLLSNGMAYQVPDSRRPVRIMPPMIDRTA